MGKNLNFVSNRCNYIIFYTLDIRAICYISINNKIIISCFLKYQLTKLLLSIKRNLEVDF